MNLAKHMLLTAYFHTTSPWRHIEARRRRVRCMEPVQILFYHRVADHSPNPWTLDCDTFNRQMDWLQQRFDLVSLAEAQRRIQSGRNDRPTALITFDDGYADNCDFALPLLLDRQLPFAYFVTSGNVLTEEPFPHDLKAGEPLRPNTVADIRALAEAGVEIGAHTRSHIDLGSCDVTRLRDEIVGSKQDLEDITGKAVRYFAFPFGQFHNMTSAGFQIAKAAGFDGVCSAYGGYNFPGGDAFHLERFHADPEFIRFKRWLSVAPLKIRTCRSFQIDWDESPTEATNATSVVTSMPAAMPKGAQA